MLSGPLTRVMNIGPIQRQSIISFTSTVGLTMVGLLSTMYFSHTIGPAVLGVYYLFLAYFGIFSLIGDAGFGNAAVKRISEGEEQNEFFTAHLVLKGILLVVTVAILVVVQCLSAGKIISDYVVIWLLIALAVSALYTTINAGTAGTGKIGVSQITHLVNNVSKIVIQVAAVFLGFGAGGLIGGLVGGMVVGLLLNLRFLDLRPAWFSRKHLSGLASFSFWIFLSSGGILIFNYTDTILIDHFMTEADVGIYRVAFQLTTFATFTTYALNNTLFPRISHWGAKRELQLVETSLARAFTYSLFLALPVCVGGWVLGDRLLYFMYGAVFTAGTPALAVLFLVQVIAVFMNLQTMSLNALDRPYDSFRATATAAGANVVLNLLLIPVMGILGAALATLGTMLLNAVLAYHALSKEVRVVLERKPVAHIVVATAVMGVVTILIRHFVPLTNIVFVVLAVALGGAVYLVTLFRLDHGIRSEMLEIAQNAGFHWPSIR